MLVAVLVRFTNFTDDLLTHDTGTIKSDFHFLAKNLFRNLSENDPFLFTKVYFHAITFNL